MLNLFSAHSRFQKGLYFFLVTMLLFSITRVALLLKYPAAFASLDGGSVAMAFANGLRFDGAVVARIYLIPLLLLWLPLRWFDRRWWVMLWGWVLYLGTLGMVGLLVGDVLYFEHVQRHVSYELLLLQNDMGFLLAFALKAHPVLLLLSLLGAAALGWLWWRILRLEIRPARLAGLSYLGLFLLLAVVARGGVSGKVIEIIDAYGSGDSAYGHLSLNGAFTTVVFALNMEAVNHNFMPQAKAVAEVRGDEALIDAEYPMLRRYDGEEKRRNVVFVLLESWNFDYVDSFSGNTLGLTPHFDALAKEGLRFSRFYAAGQRSIEGIQATLTGIPALKGMPRIDGGMGISNISRLGVLVRDRGYRTLFVQSSERDSFKIQGIAAATGFEEFYGMEDIPLLVDYPDPAGAIFGWDHDTLQFLKEKIDGLGEPFLAYAFTGTTHEPYPQLPEQFMVDEHDADGEGGYKNALRYADWSLGQFMEQAKKAPWFENTLFIFTADHVNRFQQGEFSKRFHIPMLIYGPGMLPGGESAVIGSQLDILPTILDLLGNDGEFAALGESLLRKRQGEAFVTTGGQQIGLITAQGFLRHDLNRILESRVDDSEQLPVLERRLLAKDQLSYELLQSNRWVR
ncbi:MAG: LTA synthase family protein [Chromatiales bacterium]|nr:LTA synthase family protein [Chromatiales bacterium]